MRERTTTPKRPEREPATATDREAVHREDASPLLALQRQAGNDAVVAMLEAEAAASPVLSGMTVGAVHDPAEAEADRMADVALRTMGKRAPVRRKEDEKAGGIGAAGAGPAGGALDAETAGAIAAARGTGDPLPAEVKDRMESAFGDVDFGEVRIHTDSDADALTRSLNAKAFTTGNDIFFAGGAVEEKILAHELAHVVQQGGATAGPADEMKRFMKVDDFATLTYQSMLTMKSTAQAEIEKYLAQYALLGKPVEKGKKPDSTGAPSGVAVADDKLDNAIELVSSMLRIAEAYAGNKEKVDDKGVAAKDKKTTILGEDRNKRVAGFKWFITASQQELVRLNNRKETLAQKGVEQAPVTVDTSGKQRIVDKYEGNLGTCLGLAATAIGGVCSVNGDQAELEAKLTIPIPPTNFFVGATLRFDARRDEDVTTIACDAMFTGGAKLGIANLNAGLGGYFKAAAPTPERAVKLVSYALYRRCRESSVVPSWVANGMWGEGDTASAKEKSAEDWSKRVEADEFSKDDKTYVEQGGMAEVGADVSAGILSGDAHANVRAGKRFDKTSMEATKGKAGADNTKGENWFAQESTGRSATNAEVRGRLEVALPYAGKLGLDSKLVISWRDPKKKDATGKELGAEIEEVMFEIKGNTQFPSNDFAGKVAAGASTFALWLKDGFLGEFKKLTATGVASAVVTKGYSVADATTTGLDGVGFADWIKQKAVDPSATPKPDATAAKADPDLGRVGVEFAYTYHSVGGNVNQLFEVRQLVSNSVKVPEILKAQLQRRKRIVGVKKTGTGSWSFIG